MSSVDRPPGPMSQPPERESRYCPVDHAPLEWIGRGLFRCRRCRKTWREADLR
jgi:tRNA(Ile2) C34 agmatinyltransferase TiaS